MQGKLLLFCGPSGSGKTTIVRYLLDTDPRLAFSISATTRPKRETETDGVDYHFISVDEFKRRIDAGEFVEWEEVYKDRFYGTLRSEVDRLWRENKVVVFDVDVEGGLQLKKTFGELLLAVFVMPPSVEALHQRLTARQSETPESLKARVAKAEHELTYAFRFDRVIVNDTLEHALEEAKQVVSEFIR
ncbi:MAG: guanylate kinase [Bacteroidia bacterium]|nr:guanylate kinase [Bacteroidia bacterium]MBP7436466.1 guanylate kinase [Bacteroidia bacterium]MBP7728059.1 guanylate kinase [Bacteroidia bacterium]MBP7771240.1 guanylate kinase [Bacteroidia bacterium]